MMAKGIVAGVIALVALAAAVATASGGDGLQLGPDTQFYVPQAPQDAHQQVAKLISRGDKADAALINAMVATPQAVWITGGSPNDARVLAQKTVLRAAGKNQLPVLVLYNIPLRDCSQYSAGGANDTSAYEAWIDGVAAGIGNRAAIVLLEPDALANLPVFCSPDTDPLPGDPPDANGNYKTPELHPLSAQRIAAINYAVDRLGQSPSTRVYLDAGHNAWHSVGDMARVLYFAGVERTQGFFLNVSNYQTNEKLVKYGTWLSKCLWFGSPNSGSWGAGHWDWCASQYYPANPNDFSTWGLTDQWYADNVESQTWVPYPGPAGLAHFVIDTSRNGQGPWSGPLDWCNPPGRGVGLRPTADTGNPFVDAFLWVKIPGQSDGQCTRGDTTDGTDSAWNRVDPPAGAWFPEQALQLAQLADPPLAP